MSNLFLWIFCEIFLKNYCLSLHIVKQIELVLISQSSWDFFVYHSIESILSEWTIVVVSLVFSFAINTFEKVSTRSFFLSFEFKSVSFKVSLITLCYFPIMFNFMRTIVLLVFSTIYTISKSGMSPLLVIFVLRDARVHISFLNDCNMLSYIEIFVNKTLSLCTILRVPNIDLYNSYIWLRGSLNDIRMGY